MNSSIRCTAFVLVIVANTSALSSRATASDTFNVVRGQRRTISCSSRFTIHTGGSTTGVIRQSQHARLLSNPKVTSPDVISVRIVNKELDVTKSSKMGNVSTRRTWRGKRTTWQTIKRASNVVKCELEVDLPAGLKPGSYQIAVRFPNLDSLIVAAARNRNHVEGSASIHITLHVFESQQALNRSVADTGNAGGPPFWETAMLIGIWVFVGVCVLACLYFAVSLAWMAIRRPQPEITARTRFALPDKIEDPDFASTEPGGETDVFNTFAGR